MLAVTGINDNVPIVPGPWVEWREVIEYTASIALAFVTGNIFGFLVVDVLPKTVTQGGGKPNPLAYKAAGLLGRHAPLVVWSTDVMVTAPHVRGRALATWCDQLSNPTLSTSVEAALRLAAILAIGSGSALSLP